MNRLLKKFFIILFAISAVACLFVGAACKKGDTTKDDGSGTKPNSVTVTLIGEDGTSSDFIMLPEDPLPVITVEDKDFEGYWTDAALTVPYTETTVPEEDITLYYRQNTQYYNIVFDYGTLGEPETVQVARGETIEIPSVLTPAGTDFAGFALKPGTEAVYAAGQQVSDLGVKGQTITLYAVWTSAEDSNFIIEDGTLISYTGSATELTLPLTASRVSANLFMGNRNASAITSLTVPDCYTEIECGAFKELKGLTSLTVPFIGGSRTSDRFLAYVFGANNYKDNSYSFSLYSNGDDVQMGPVNTSSLVIPQTLTKVRITEEVRDFAEGAFYFAYGLENVMLDYPETLSKIGNSAFEGCYSLGRDLEVGTLINFEWLSNVSYIGENAFRSYTGNTENTTTSMNFGGTIYELVTYDTPLNNLGYIPKLENVVTIGNDAFYYCAMLSGLEFGDKLQSIGSQAFMFSLSLKEVRFPDSLRTIGNFAFNGSGVSVVEFGNGLRSIGSMAFAQCADLNEIILNGDNIPVLNGGQCFSNNVEESVSGGWNVSFNDGFCITVKESLAGSFRTAPDWAEYFGYINASDTQNNALAVGYMSLYGNGWDVRFDFSAGNTVFVYDPSLEFITNLDTYGMYSQSIGTKYPLRYEVLDDAAYAEFAGENAKPLYENQVAVCMWHPLIVSQDGALVYTYFVVTKLPYGSSEGAVLLPVVTSVGYTSAYGSTEEGTYNVSINKGGVVELSKIENGVAVPVADPEGTYYAELVVDQNSGKLTILYYNNKFDVIDSKTFVTVVENGLQTGASLYELEDNAVFVRTSATYSADKLFLKGDGTAEITFRGESYTAKATVLSNSSYGAENFTVNFSEIKRGGVAADGLTGKAVFMDFDGADYARIDLTIGSESSMIVNAVNADDWSVKFYNKLESEPVVKIPTYSAAGDLWRYAKLSTPNVLASVNFYGYNGKTYFTQFDGDDLISFGVAKMEGDNISLVPAGGNVINAAVNSDGNLEIGGAVYTYYDYFTDITISYKSVQIFNTVWYYTVKADGYGNMFMLDESSGSRNYFLGTYEMGESLVNESQNYAMFKFTGKVVTSTGGSVSGAVSDTIWIIYDAGNLKLRQSAGDSPWEGSIIGLYAPTQDTVIEVVDEYGFKVFDITIDIYGMPVHTEYTYTIGKDGQPVYSEKEQSKITLFIPVYDEDNNLVCCVAIGEDGISKFIIRPVSVDDKGKITCKIEYVTGIMSNYGSTAVKPDIQGLESVDSDKLFGNI